MDQKHHRGLNEACLSTIINLLNREGIYLPISTVEIAELSDAELLNYIHEFYDLARSSISG